MSCSRLLILAALFLTLAASGAGQAGPTLSQTDSLNKEGIAAYQAGDHAKALALWEQGLELARHAGDKQAQAKFLHNLGAVKVSLKRFEEALAHYQEALTLVRERRDRREEFLTLFNLGNLFDKWQRFTEALDYYKQALQVAREVENKEGEARALTNLGTVYENLGRQEKALSSFHKALKIVQDMGDKEGEEKIYNNLGLIYADQRKYAEAQEAYQQALKLARQRQDRRSEATLLFNLGTLLEYQLKYAEAAELLQQALSLAQELPDRRLMAMILNNQGTMALDQGRYAEGLALIEESLKIKQEEGDRLAAALTLLNLGSIYESLGQTDRAQSAFQNSLALYRELKTPAALANALLHVGNALSLRGRYEPAIAYYTQALAVYRDLQNRREEARLLVNLGAVYFFLNQAGTATELYEQALAIARELQDRSQECRALLNLGAARRQLSRFDDARAALEQALAIARTLEDKEVQTQALLNLGSLAQLRERPEEALPLYQQASAIAQELKKPGAQALVLTNLAILHRDQGQYDKAVETGRQALRLARENRGLRILSGALQALASAEGMAGQAAEAIGHYEEALALVESMRAGITGREAQAAFMTGKFFVYDQLISLLLHLHDQDPDKGYDKKALEIFERRQGRIFLEEMGKSGARRFAGLPPAVRSQEQELEAQEDKLKASLAQAGSRPGGADPRTLEGLNAKLQEIKKAQERLQAEIKEKHPAYYALRYPRPATVAELQKQVLRDKEVMLIYGVMSQQTVLWVVGKKKFAVFSLEVGKKALGEKVQAFRRGVEAVLEAINAGKSAGQVKSVAQESLASLRQQGRELYDLLVPMGARPLITGAAITFVVPTGPLYALPFEALTLPASEGKKPVYLLERRPLTYLSSASLLKTLREAQSRRQAPAAYPLLAFAHPAYAQTPEQPEEDGSLRGLRTRAYKDLLGGGLPELPDTAEEVKAIKETLKAPEQSQPLHLREAAARSRLLRMQEAGELTSYRYLVFSCHGVAPPETDPVLQPALILSHPDPATGGEGFLTMGDVFGLTLNADLVVLSACNTGKGRVLQGEGVAGLTRAFMFAGSPAVAVTLWSVESSSAKALSTGLFAALAQGKPRAAALRQAKLQLLQDQDNPLFQHPFFWAPLIIFGDG